MTLKFYAKFPQKIFFDTIIQNYRGHPIQVADQQVEVKWSQPADGGPPSEYVVVFWKDGEDNKKVEQTFPSNIFTCVIELEPDCKYNVTVIARNSAGNRSPPIPVRLKTLPVLVQNFKSKIFES